jgi:hypothetical protein
MATKVNFMIEQGTDIQIDINISDVDIVDISGYTARSQMRRHYQSSSYHAFTATVQDSNTVVLTMSSALSANVSPGRYVYDVELVSPANTVTRLVEGQITVTPEVTR